ncbi:unnamed protein product [Vicia faba]|uniref:DUF668 domain-containing protein n=1 Tax=Vicia faba TaxID=3906 RepID=A0AAV0ZPG5_VICFA|nr:unnamed protein product [Vicia faba]
MLNVDLPINNQEFDRFNLLVPFSQLMGFLKKKKSPTTVNQDEVFYDGIPRYVEVDRVFANSDVTAPPEFPEITESPPTMFFTTESHAMPTSFSSKQPTVVSDVSSRLGRATRPGKVLGFWDSFGSASSKFVSGTTISILAFEVANTIIKEAVHDLVSKDKDELLRIVAADKLQELKLFLDEVTRFGNRSKDPQLRNLDLYFEKISNESSAQRLSRDEAESLMQELMTSAQFTVELYHKLSALNRLEEDFLLKGEKENQRGDNLAFLRATFKSQRKQIKHLKKKSLWCRSLEEVIEKLSDIVLFIHLEIRNSFGSAVCSERCILHARVHADGQKPIIVHIGDRQRLGTAGLALHYANIVLQIDTLVARSISMLANRRDSLYQNLPPNIKSTLRSKLPSYHAVEELTVAEIKYEMEKTLHWLVPIAANTSKAHHCFGWLGEWDNTASEVDKKVFQGGVMRIETFHYAYKDKVEHYILQLLLWLHRLAIKSKIGNRGLHGS